MQNRMTMQNRILRAGGHCRLWSVVDAAKVHAAVVAPMRLDAAAAVSTKQHAEMDMRTARQRKTAICRVRMVLALTSFVYVSAARKLHLTSGKSAGVWPFMT
jgi:hypothetical protein